MNYLIIVAGGNGERMKLHYNKIFARLNKKPIIYWTIKAFEESKSIDKIIVSAKQSDVSEIKKIISKAKFKKVLNVIAAKTSRQESTYEVLLWLQTKAKPDDLIGVHNAVNPFIRQEEIAEVYNQAKKTGAALLGFPATDTVKITNGGNFVETTPIRKHCWYAQTPQVSTLANLTRAFQKAEKDKFLGTDDTQLLERIGIKPKVVICSHWNFKITFQEDLIAARRILKIFQNAYV